MYLLNEINFDLPLTNPVIVFFTGPFYNSVCTYFIRQDKSPSHHWFDTGGDDHWSLRF